MRVGIFDYDNTVAGTFMKHQGIVSVTEAYDLAVKAVMGEHAFNFYRDQGGLRNRSPRQVIAELLGYFDSRSLTGKRRDDLRRYLDKNRGWLEEHSDYKFPEDIQEDNIEPVATELLICHKLSLMADQVGTKLEDGSRWPSPIGGFTHFWPNFVSEQDLKTLIVSSGHRLFIDRWFELYDLSPPDAQVTSDETRRLNSPVDKPDPHILRMGFKILGFTPKSQDMAMFGDDPVKDGEMADVAACRFVLIDPHGKHPDHPDRVTDWTEVPLPFFTA